MSHRASEKKEQGQALVEFALVLPVQLLFTLAIMQFSLMYIAKQITEYAAFCAARAALVHGETGREQSAARRAAKMALASIYPHSDSDQQFVEPRLMKYVPPDSKVRVDLSRSSKKEVVAIVKFDYELVIPAINKVIVVPNLPFIFIGGGSGALRPNEATRRHNNIPHITVQGLCVLPKPWVKY